MDTQLTFQGQSSRHSHNDNVAAGLKVLVGVNDAALRCLLASILRADGHEVCEAADGATMLEQIAELFTTDCRPFDIVIAEQRDPIMPGLFILAGIRSSGRNTPFILVTNEPRVRNAAQRIGAIVLAAPPPIDLFRVAIGESQTGCATTREWRHR